MLKLLLFALIGLSCYLSANAFKEPHSVNGRSAFVHLFEWKWTDIAQECERFLAPKGYAGVQISPPNEHALVENPYRPWWQRYQPVSYKLDSRSGSEKEFKDMVSRCNAVGVRIYVDAIINHMTREIGFGTSGSYHNNVEQDFPAVPYSKLDFNDGKCKSGSGQIENYNDPYQVRDCQLDRLPDLAMEKDYVRGKVAGYLNSLIDIGVAGFRIDAAKHMWPGDLQNVFNQLNNLREDVFGANKRPFIFQEVIDMGGEPIKNTDYTPLARVTEFKFGIKLSEVVRKHYGQRLAYLKNFGTGWSFIEGSDAVAFIDNHDNQRGHGGGGSVLNFRESRGYKIANAFMLAWPYSFPKVMSSYSFPYSEDWLGPPSNGNGDTKDVIINSDDTCGNGWICEHRWRQIYNMVGFRNAAGVERVDNWWDNGGNQIAFSRGNKAFLAINNENYNMDYTLQTGLPAGQYCDVISGNKINGSCTGKVIQVNNDGTARLSIKSTDEDPMIAIHLHAKLDV